MICFNIVPSFLGATRRHYAFIIKSLIKVEKILEGYNIPFVLVFGDPENTVSELAHNIKASHIITDFNPLRIPREWKTKLCAKLENTQIAVHTVRPPRFDDSFLLCYNMCLGVFIFRWMRII